MSSYLPGRDEVPGTASPCVNDQIINPIHLTERPNTLLPVIAAVIDSLDDLAVIEDQGSLEKVYFPFFPVFLALAFVPREQHDARYR
jgi:hypothetical protein